MPASSTIFKSNRSQAVRLPKELAFSNDVKKVFVRRVGKSVILTPVDAQWDDFFDQPGIDIAEPADLPPQERSFD